MVMMLREILLVHQGSPLYSPKCFFVANLNSSFPSIFIYHMIGQIMCPLVH